MILVIDTEHLALSGTTPFTSKKKYILTRYEVEISLLDNSPKTYKLELVETQENVKIEDVFTELL